MKKTTILSVRAVLWLKKLKAKRLKLKALALLALLYFIMGQLQAQERLKGRVVDAQTKEPLAGATIKVLNPAKTFVSDNEGYFELNLLKGVYQLSIIYLSYHTKEQSLTIPFAGNLLISLQANENTLQEVNIVSTGYQILPKERATGSFVLLDNTLLNRRVSTNILERLEGVVPGLLFNRNTYENSLGVVDISIRGTGTLYADKAPLIILDGFPYDGDLASINPNDIQDITILKDAAAASIWGVRSGNGVIVMTSKKGVRGQKIKIELNTNVSLGNAPDLYYSPNFINSSQFIDLERELFSKGYYANDLRSGYIPISPVVEILNSQLSEQQKLDRIAVLRGLDMRADLGNYFYQGSNAGQYALNLKGGGEQSDYFVSLGYDHNRGNLVGNGGKRITLNVINNFSIGDKMSVGLNLNLIESIYKNNSPLAAFNSGGGKNATLYPYAQLVGTQGEGLSISHDYTDSYKTSFSGLAYNWDYVPLDELAFADNTSNISSKRIAITSKYNFFKGLNLEGRYQYEQRHTQGKNYAAPESYYTRNLVNRFTAGLNTPNPIYRVPQGGILNEIGSELVAQRARLQLNYGNNLGKEHEINAIVGAEANQSFTDGSAKTLYGYSPQTTTSLAVDAVSSFPTLPTGSSRIPLLNGISRTTDEFLSYYANAAYTYKNRYTFSASGRIDKSNLFGVNVNNRQVPLFSVGGLWNLKKETFLKLPFLAVAQLRVSYGYNGNIDKSVTGLTTIRYSNGSLNNYSGEPYASISNPGNPELRWERTEIVNFGLDFASKERTLSGNLEFYLKNGKDLIGDSPLPPSVGLVLFRGNSADIRGKGVDLTLSSWNIRGRNFSWESQLLYSYTMDKVKSYKVNQLVNTYMQAGSNSFITPLTGRPVYAVFAYPSLGLDHNGMPQGVVDGLPSIDYATIFNNTTLENMNYIGTSRPTSFGSLRNTFRYGQLSLGINLVYKFNYYFRRSSISYSSLFQSWRVHKDYEKRWQKPGDELLTDVPVMIAPPGNSNMETFYKFSTALVEKGDHIRLQDINIGYTLDKKKISRLPVERIDFTGYINNIGLIWKANNKGLDPDLFDQYNIYPLATTFSFGIKAQF